MRKKTVNPARGDSHGPILSEAAATMLQILQQSAAKRQHAGFYASPEIGIIAADAAVFAAAVAE